MNKIFLLLLFSILSSLTFAQGNSLSVFSEDGHAFYLILNGIRQNENPETNVRIDNLMNEYYAAKVIFNNTQIAEIDKKFLSVSAPDCFPCDVTYKIKTNKNGEVVMTPFSFSNIFVAPPPTVTVVQYNTTPMPPPVFGMNVQVSETTTTTTTTSTTGYNDNVNMGVNFGGFNMGVNVNVNDGWSDGGSSTTTTTSTTTVVAPNVVAPAPVMVVEQAPGCFAMDNATLQSLLTSMDNQSFDEGKLTIAKQATAANCLTSAQVKQVMQKFDWEDNRLDYAKYAYNYCLDQNNYWKVNDAFEWSDSVEELNNAIGR